MSKCPTVLAVKIFYHQIIAKLPQNPTELVKLLKTHESWSFLKNFFRFFEQTWIFSIWLKVGNMLKNPYQMINFHENVSFPFEFRVFCSKILNLEKLLKFDEDQKKFFLKNALIFLKCKFSKTEKVGKNAKGGQSSWFGLLSICCQSYGVPLFFLRSYPRFV